MAGFSGAQQLTMRLMLDAGGAIRGLATFEGRWRRFTAFTSRFRAGMLGMNTMLMGQGAIMVGVGLGLRSAVRSAEAYSNAQAELRAILATTNIDMRVHEQLMQVTDVAARRFGYGMSETTQAMSHFAEMGFNAHEMLQYFPQAVEFARAAEVDLTRSTEVLGYTIRQFGQYGSENVRRIAATFTVAGRMSATSITDLQQASRYAAVEMSAMGYQMGEVVAALGAMSAIGLRSTTAGTRLRRAIVQLVDPTKATIDHFRTLGIEENQLRSVMYDDNRQRRTLADTTIRLAAMFQTLRNEQDRDSASWKLFGVRGYAAGAMLAQLHREGARFLEINQALNRGDISAALGRTSQTRVEGFAHQMRLARQSVENFGIGFMQLATRGLQRGERGFGDYLADLAMSIRYGERWYDNTEEMTQLLRNMNPEIHQTANEIRDMFTEIGNFAREFWTAIEPIRAFTREHPKLAANILIFGSIVRPMIPLIGAWATGISNVGTAAAATGTATGAMATGGMASAIGVFPVLIAGAAMYGASMWALHRILANQGLTEEYAAFNDEMERSARTVPLVGDAWASLVNIPVIRELWQLAGILQHFIINKPAEFITSRMSGARNAPTLSASAQAEYRASSGTEGTIDSRREIQYRRSVRNQMEQLASYYAARPEGTGVRGTEEQSALLRGRLESLGVEEQRIQEFIRIYENASRTVSSESSISSERLRQMGVNATTVSENLAGLAERMGELGIPTSGGRQSIAPVQDAYVARGGFLNVSPGDVVVDRNSLASAIAYGRGGAVGGGAQSQGGAMPNSQQPPRDINLSATFEIPVTIDGREVARAIGREVLRVQESRGAAGSSGARRRVAATGVP